MCGCFFLERLGNKALTIPTVLVRVALHKKLLPSRDHQLYGKVMAKPENSIVFSAVRSATRISSPRVAPDSILAIRHTILLPGVSTRSRILYMRPVAAFLDATSRLA